MKTTKSDYKKALRKLQIELVKLQRHVISSQSSIMILFEGRDASGKDGTIKRITEYLSPRDTRVVALGKPTELETRAWYFQRYVTQLPLQGEIVLLNRSWYNRAGVEKVMGFCTDAEYETFMQTVNDFELLLINSGITLLKYYLDITRDEQRKRLAERRESPLTQWKSSPIDKTAIKHWRDYTVAKEAMLERTHTLASPWIVVNADDKEVTRLNVIRDILQRVKRPDKNKRLAAPDPAIVSLYRPAQ
jgi:polyphosphate kinase 2